MTAVLQQGTALDRHQSTSVFSFALLLSLALHVIAGGILTPFWLKAEEKITPPILVMLEAAPAPVTVKEIGIQLMGPHAAALLVAGLLLTVALLGAIVIAATERSGDRRNSP